MLNFFSPSFSSLPRRGCPRPSERKEGVNTVKVVAAHTHARARLLEEQRSRRVRRDTTSVGDLVLLAAALHDRLTLLFHTLSRCYCCCCCWWWCCSRLASAPLTDTMQRPKRCNRHQPRSSDASTLKKFCARRQQNMRPPRLQQPRNATPGFGGEEEEGGREGKGEKRVGVNCKSRWG